jgi:hypothetical protein
VHAVYALHATHASICMNVRRYTYRTQILLSFKLPACTSVDAFIYTLLSIRLHNFPLQIPCSCLLTITYASPNKKPTQYGTGITTDELTTSQVSYEMTATRTSRRLYRTNTTPFLRRKYIVVTVDSPPYIVNINNRSNNIYRR